MHLSNLASSDIRWQMFKVSVAENQFFEDGTALKRSCGSELSRRRQQFATPGAGAEAAAAVMLNLLLRLL